MNNMFLIELLSDTRSWILKTCPPRLWSPAAPDTQSFIKWWINVTTPAADLFITDLPNVNAEYWLIELKQKLHGQIWEWFTQTLLKEQFTRKPSFTHPHVLFDFHYSVKHKKRKVHTMQGLSTFNKHKRFIKATYCKKKLEQNPIWKSHVFPSRIG